MNSHRSLFFPLALVAAGVLWLLINTGVVPAGNLWALAHFWPIVLIILGLGMILRSYWAPAGLVASVLIVLSAVLVVIYAQQLGWANSGSFWSIGLFGGGASGSKNIETETRELSEFNSISIEYPADYVIVPGDATSVRIQADDNLLPQLSTQVTGGKLVIDNREKNWGRRVSPSQTVKITITVVGLNIVDFSSAGSMRFESLSTNELSVSLDGAGEIVLTNLHAEQLNASMSGAGSIQASGIVESLVVDLDGVGSFEGQDLDVQFARVSINGAGSATVRVAQTLKAEINGAGSIEYYGSPVVEEDINGLGSVSKKGD